MWGQSFNCWADLWSPLWLIWNPHICSVGLLYTQQLVLLLFGKDFFFINRRGRCWVVSHPTVILYLQAQFSYEQHVYRANDYHAELTMSGIGVKRRLQHAPRSAGGDSSFTVSVRRDLPCLFAPCEESRDLQCRVSERADARSTVYVNGWR